MNSTISIIHKQSSIVSKVAKNNTTIFWIFFFEGLAATNSKLASSQTINSYNMEKGYGGRHQMMVINFLIQR